MKNKTYFLLATYITIACLSWGICPGAISSESVDRSKYATYRFEMQFSESGLFACISGKSKLGLGAGVRSYDAPLPQAIANEDLPSLIGVEIETYPTKNTNHIDSFSGLANFSDDDRKMSVKLNNNKTAYFERFGPTPEWPFKSKKDSQFFFTFRLDDGPIFKCKAVYQPDQ